MLWQVLINAIVSGAALCLVAIGFGIIYSISRFFNFTHGLIFTSGAYFTLLLNYWIGVPILLSILISIFASTLLASLIEIAIYRPLRYKHTSPLILLIASLGIYIVLQNIISLAFGDDTKTIRPGIIREGIKIFGARITPIQILIIAVSVVLVIAVGIFLKMSKMGRAMRAVANCSELAKLSGIDSDRVILWTFAIGSALAGIAGILVSLDVDMTPTMGMNALMMGVVAVIIGGVGSIPGVAMGALLLSAAQNLGAFYISSQWQDAIAFVILLIFLLFRPQGFLGKKVKKATV
jgi:branched-chain amino acid transport system permease protein